MVLFLLSLSNSIFINQIGIYFAFLLILVRFGITRKNHFSKTGLELALVLYIIAELFSAIFSDYSYEAFNLVLKRVLLFPVIYTTVAAVTDLNKGKLYFKLYMAGTLVTVLIYLYFSYYYVINNMYGQTQSGPSLFQYPITASEIMSFTVIFLFAFLVNEKTNWRNKILLLIGFGLSFLALVSTYKRTGWVGAAFGILTVLILKKQWKIIITAFVVVIAMLFTQENISKVIVFESGNNGFVPSYSFETDGRAYDIADLDELFAVSDFDNGLSIYKDSVLVKNIDIPGLVRSFKQLKGNYYLAYLEDTRFLTLKRNNLNFKQVNEFISPGYTILHRIANECVYALDNDSGLTIFTDPAHSQSNIRYPRFANKNNFFVDSSNIFFASADSGFSVYSIIDKLPGNLIYNNKKPGLENISYQNGKLIAAYPDGFYLYNVDSAGIVVEQEFKSVNNIFRISETGKGFLIIKRNGEVSKLNITEFGKNNLSFLTKLDFLPDGVNLNQNKLCFTKVNRSRLLGIFDIYHPSNKTRLALWRAGFEIFKDHPVFGVGDIDLAKYYRIYKRSYDKEIQGHMHNNFVHILVTLGLFGFLVICYLLYKIIAIDLKIIKNVKSKPFVSSYAIGALATFGAVLVSGLTELNFWDHEITTLIYFVFGLNVALSRYSLLKEDLPDKS
jgi:hypothetical protein